MSRKCSNLQFFLCLCQRILMSWCPPHLEHNVLREIAWRKWLTERVLKLYFANKVREGVSQGMQNTRWDRILRSLFSLSPPFLPLSTIRSITGWKDRPSPPRDWQGTTKIVGRKWITPTNEYRRTSIVLLRTACPSS